PPCLPDELVLQVPAWVLLEGDTVTLRCRRSGDKTVTSVFFYREEEELGGPRNGTELSLSPVQLHDSGRYHCGGWLDSGLSRKWEESEPVTVTVHSENPQSYN
ncbi:FCRLA protein, partial [Malurus elegans]|nr:FCRLA protein [Malurus elegans]